MRQTSFAALLLAFCAGLFLIPPQAGATCKGSCGFCFDTCPCDNCDADANPCGCANCNIFMCHCDPCEGICLNNTCGHAAVDSQAAQQADRAASLQRFAEMDTTADNAITPRELKAWLKRNWESLRPSLANGATLRKSSKAAFVRLDANQDGKVTPDETGCLATSD